MKIQKIFIKHVCGAQLNAYFPRLVSDKDFQEEIVTKMLSLTARPNKLAAMIQDMSANRLRSVFPAVNTQTDVHAWFFDLSLDDMYFCAQWSYQLGYCANDARRLHESGILYQCHGQAE